MRQINQILGIVVLSVFALSLSSCGLNSIDDSLNSKSSASLKDTVQTDHTSLDYSALSKTAKNAKVESNQPKSERLNISLPDIITYFMSSF
jgi:hypothetical protein